MSLDEIKRKHHLLKRYDGGSFFRSPTYKVFGATSHKYKFNPCLSENEIKRFEQKHIVDLPTDYRNFLLEIGNGGSGPAYGLLKITEWNIELDITKETFLSTPFPHSTRWNMERHFDMDDDNVYESQEFQDWEEEYYSNKHVTGSIRICHYGCAIYYLLVVNGTEKGNIWVDDRANDEGIYPALSKKTGKQLSFIEWYNEWLDESLQQLS
jgi:hypothetical protein